MVGKTLGEDGGGVRVALDAASPVHGDGNDDIDICGGEAVGMFAPDQFADVQRERLVAGVLHAQQPVAEEAIVLAEGDRFVEPEFDAAATGAEWSWLGGGGKSRHRSGALAASRAAEERKALQAVVAERGGAVRVEFGTAAEADGRIENVERRRAAPGEHAPAGGRHPNQVVARC